MKPSVRPKHPFEHHPSFRAVLSAAPSLAELSREMKTDDLLPQLTLACGELVYGFSSPPESAARRVALHRAWVTVRQIDRVIMSARLGRLAPRPVIARAQRAIDRADVLVGALLPD